MRRTTTLLTGLLVTATLTALAAMPAAAAPKTRWVDDDGRAGPVGCKGTARASKRIQRAVDLSAVGDIVKVCPGTYVGQVTIATRRVRVEATAALKARIKAAPDHPDGGSLVSLEASGVRFTGFRLQALTVEPCVRVGNMLSLFQANNARIDTVRTESLGTETLGSCGYHTGMAISDASGVAVSGALVSEFQSAGINIVDAPQVSVTDTTLGYAHPGQPQPGDSGRVGLLAQGTTTGTLQRITLSTLVTAGSTSPLLDEGITLRSSVSLLDSTVGRSAIGIGLVGEDATATVDGNTITDSRYRAIQLSSGVTGATISDNTVTLADEYGIHVSGLSTAGNTFTGNDVSGSGANDCYDDTSGSGTQSTANTWAASNHGPQDFPNGICPAP